jgi:hypothetical protein
MSSTIVVRSYGASSTSTGSSDPKWLAMLLAAAAAGRAPGEAAVILPPQRRRTLLARLVGMRMRSPLADPRLEVVRAISASLRKGAAHIRADLIAAADHVGLTPLDLSRTFPGVAVE